MASSYPLSGVRRPNIRPVTAAGLGALPAPAPLPGDAPPMRVLGFNDVHGQVADPAGDPAGADWRAERCRAWQAERQAGGDRPTLLLGAGDDHAGTWLDAGMTDPAASGDPVYRLYHAAGVDALTLGNHDLDWGKNRLIEQLGQDAPPRVATNLAAEDPLAGVCASGLIAEWSGLPWRVGILGLLTDDQTRDPPRLLPLTEIMDDWIPNLLKFCHKIIILSHLGLIFDQNLLSRYSNPRILILGGHSHHRVPDAEGATHLEGYGQAGSGGDHLIVADWGPDASAPAHIRLRSLKSVEASRPSPELLEAESHVRSDRDRWRAAFPDLHLPHDPGLRRALASDSPEQAYRAESPTLTLLAEATRSVLPEAGEPGAWVCLDVRAWSGRPLTESLDFFGWHACLPYPDYAQMVDIPFTAVPALITAMEQRMLLGPGFRSDAGRWQGDHRLRWASRIDGRAVRVEGITYQETPIEALAGKNLKIISSAYICQGFGGNDAYFRSAVMDLQPARPVDPDRPFRDILRDGLRAF
ncbi:MAG: metallophosphoesterase [Opitutales bacterium]